MTGNYLVVLYKFKQKDFPNEITYEYKSVHAAIADWKYALLCIQHTYFTTSKLLIWIDRLEFIECVQDDGNEQSA